MTQKKAKISEDKIDQAIRMIRKLKNDPELKEYSDFIDEVLEQYSESGSSELLDELLGEDYEEFPVSMEQFLSDPDYLGDYASRLYSLWKKVLIDIFDHDKGYLEVALSGAIGIGKTEVGCIIVIYLLYQLLCLKSPYVYYNVSNIVIAFVNLNLDLAESVGYKRFHDIILTIPWFRRHGRVSGSAKKGNQKYHPGKGVKVIVASSNKQLIGKDVYCVSGNSRLVTSEGILPIEDLAKKPDLDSIKILGYDMDTGELKFSGILGVIKSPPQELYRITFEGGSTVECTIDHKFLTNVGYVDLEEILKDPDFYEIIGV